MKLKTVHEGERAILINRNGELEEVQGPKQIFLVLSKLEKLRRHVAHSNQFLIIKYTSGEVEHLPGPAIEWFNRFRHEYIRVSDCVKLDESQLVVVYRRDSASKQVSRRLVKGPCVYMIESNEWLHVFNWHKPDKENVGHMVHTRSTQDVAASIHALITPLTLKPDFFHYHVKEVRTSDDSLITVKLMVVYELVDVDLMLDRTQDPIADFINAICADVVSMVAKLTFTQFLAESSVKLNDLNSYEQLRQRANRNGYRITSINYTGYTSSDALQNMQDDAIQSRTEMRLSADVDKQKNELAGLKLNGKSKRLAMESELGAAESEFGERLAGLRAKFKCEADEARHEVELKLKDIEMHAQEQLESRRIEIEMQHLEQLKGLGVDVDRYQTELVRAKSKIDTVYQLIQ